MSAIALRQSDPPRNSISVKVTIKFFDTRDSKDLVRGKVSSVDNLPGSHSEPFDANSRCGNGGNAPQVRKQERRLAMTRRYLLIAIVSATVLVGTVWAQKAAIPKQADKVVLAEENVKELLLLMDSDRDGRISKQEWMKFMAMEFDRFDKEKKGELNQEGLRQSTVLAKHARFSDLGK